MELVTNMTVGVTEIGNKEGFKGERQKELKKEKKGKVKPR